mgnify:CR=1 FL=1
MSDVVQLVYPELHINLHKLTVVWSVDKHMVAWYDFMSYKGASETQRIMFQISEL